MVLPVSGYFLEGEPQFFKLNPHFGDVSFSFVAVVSTVLSTSFLTILFDVTLISFFLQNKTGLGLNMQQNSKNLWRYFGGIEKRSMYVQYVQGI